MTARRGDKLREDILWTAKNVFLELGFERASMDVIAARAGTSKRTVYAHFESKEKLYLAVVELVRGLSLDKLKTPGEYGDNPAAALTEFCGRFLEILLYASTVGMCRVIVAEAARFPEGAARYHDVLFCPAQERLAAYLRATFGLRAPAAAQAAERLLGRIVYPRFLRALFGLDELSERLGDETIRPDLDLQPVRHAVTELLASLPKPVRENRPVREQVILWPDTPPRLRSR